MELVKLFISFIKVGAFSFGGGYAMIPFIQEEVIVKNQWIDYKEFLDMIAISQVTPGPIAINTATFIGAKVAGMAGGVTASIAVVLPSFMVVMTMIMIINKYGKTHLMDTIQRGLRPVVMALILSALYSVGKASLQDFKSVILAIVVFGLLYKTKLNIFLAMILSGVVGLLIF